MFFKGKKFVVFALVCVLALCTLTICACAPTGVEDGEKTVTIIIGDSVIEERTDAVYMHDLLQEMSEEGDVEYEWEDGAYGATVMRLNELVTSTDWTSWIGYYIDLNDVSLISPGYDVEHEGKTYYSAAMGVSILPVKDGVTYLFLQN